MRQNSEPFNAPNWVQLSSCRKSVGYIIATSAAQRESLHPSAGMTTPEYIEDRGVVLTTVVSSCLRHQAVTVCDEDQEDLRKVNWTGSVFLLLPELSFW
jgi:hypothetical protein